ncbi:MAG: hypothetical protein Kow0042_23810 [Calditrichia bacterium]
MLENFESVQLLLNVGYALMLVALAVHDILWLRSILIAAQLSLFSYAIAAGNTNVAFWNFLFFCINIWQIIRLLKERQSIELPGELQDLYQNVFSAMRKREFLYFWHMGSIKSVRDVFLIRQGHHQSELSLILQGTVEVIKNGKVIARLSRGSFIAEMSYLTGEPASADVRASEEVQYISWKQEKLRGLNKLNPDLLIKIQNILGRDLADKIKVASITQTE